jgi:hypothetical protein
MDLSDLPWLGVLHWSGVNRKWKWVSSYVMQRHGPTHTKGWGHIHFNSCNKGVKVNILESFFIHILQKQNLLIEEQVTDSNPLYELAQHVALHH